MRVRGSEIALLAMALSLIGGCTEPENTLALCTDCISNDGDKFVDCQDLDCWQTDSTGGLRPIDGLVCPGCVCNAERCICDGEATAEEKTAETCTDEMDNDADQLFDCWDPDCWEKTGTEPWAPLLGVACPEYRVVEDSRGQLTVQVRCVVEDCPEKECHTATCTDDNQCEYASDADGGPCSDGKACTDQDTCDGGVCVGTLACEDKECQSSACGADGQCTYESADPGMPCPDERCNTGACNGDGQCVQTPVADGADCLINKCIVGATCGGGSCSGGTAKCVKQACEQSVTCDQRTGECNSTLLPNGTECQSDYCHFGTCNGAAVCATSTVVTSEACGLQTKGEGWECWDFTCVPETGCKQGDFLGKSAQCDDGNECTVNDNCSSGKCAGTPLPIDDNNPCTLDACVEGEVKHEPLPVNSPCDAPNACAASGLCDSEAICQPVGGCTELPEEACSVWQCNKDSGKCDATDKADGVSCDDESFCTEPDQCAAGACAGTPKACDDSDPGTTDVCNEELDMCVNTPKCSDAACEAKVDNPCAKGECSATWECVEVPISGSCNDGNECTLDDQCSSGACSGTQKSCDDAPTCTVDSCAADGQCQHDLQPGFCLIAGVCYGAGPKPGDPCTECDPAAAPNAWSNTTNKCDDNNGCTTDDTCQDGACYGGPAKDCADDFACTVDGCAAGECTHTEDDAACDDDNPCTDNVCSETSGCVSTNNTLPCKDADECTTNEICAGGVCDKTAVTCKDDWACTADTCDPVLGCQFATNDALCDDTVACTEDVCSEETGCGNAIKPSMCHIDGACVAAGANPDNPCLACVPGTSTTEWTDNDGPCDDQDACTAQDQCSAGVCVGAVRGPVFVGEELNAVAVDGESVYVAGFVKGSGGDHQGLLTRLDHDGNVLKTAPLLGGDKPDGLAAVTIAEGRVWASGAADSVPGGGSDALIAVLDTDLNVLHQEVLTDVRALQALATLPGGSVMAVGKDAHVAEFAFDPVNALLLTKYHQSGAKYRTYTDVLVLSGGDALLVGNAGTTDTHGVFIRRTKAGSYDKEWTYDPTGEKDGLRALAIRPNGGVMVVGTSVGQGVVVPVNAQHTVTEPQILIGGSGTERLQGVTPHADGYLAVGSTDSPSAGQTTHAWLVQLTSVGGKAWDKQVVFEAGKTSNFINVAPLGDPDEGYVVVGYSDSQADGLRGVVAFVLGDGTVCGID